MLDWKPFPTTLVGAPAPTENNAPCTDVMVDVTGLLETDWEELMEQLIAHVELEPRSHAADSCLTGLEWLRNTILDREEQRRYNMPKTILSINAGSSSLKITLFSVEGPSTSIKKIAAAEISGFTDPPAKEKYTRGSHSTKNELPHIKSHHDAFQQILASFINDKDLKEVQRKEDISYACHRVVHGGDYTADHVINTETYHKIEELEDLAPLHNASAVAILQVCFQQLPTVQNIACFDSVFHHTLPDYVRTYAIDQKIAKEKGLRKYGFHGISYSYILRAVSHYLGKEPSETSIIALHLGSGASVCAIQHGKSLDTSMGLTPVCGLPGGSRSGDIDPSLIFHYTSEAARLSPSSTKDLHISAAEDILNKQSGWKALTGTTDFSKIADENAPDSHKLAFNIFVDRIVGYVGSYFVKLNGQVDALVFAGGIGEKSALLRRRVVEKCACLGFAIDDDKNSRPGEARVAEIGTGHKSRTLVCRTDEEYEMAYNSMTHRPIHVPEQPK